MPYEVLYSETVWYRAVIQGDNDEEAQAKLNSFEFVGEEIDRDNFNLVEFHQIHQDYDSGDPNQLKLDL